MPNWEGNERRKDSLDFRSEIIHRFDIIDFKAEALNKKVDVLSEDIKHANANTKAFKVLIDEDIQELKVSIQGNKSKGIQGISTEMQLLVKEATESRILVDAHVISDTLRFDKIDKMLVFQNKIVYGAIGIIVFIEFIFKIK